MEGTGPPKVLPETTGMAEPYSYGGEEGEDTEGYLKKTSLSPWVPTPDPIARKLFDMSAPTPEDVSSCSCVCWRLGPRDSSSIGGQLTLFRVFLFLRSTSNWDAAMAV